MNVICEPSIKCVGEILVRSATNICLQIEFAIGFKWK